MHVAATMFQFAVWKVFPTYMGPPAQLWPPLLGDLTNPLGEVPAGGFFWQWPGVAPAYVLFTGLVEFIGATMMLFDRTLLLGTFLNLVSLLNIAIMIQGFFGLGNEFFWTPGTRFFAIAFLIWDQWPRVRGYLVRDEREVPAFAGDLWPKGWPRTLACVVVALMVVRVVWMQQWLSLVQHALGIHPRWEVEAVYEVTEFARGDDARSGNDGTRWTTLSVQGCRGIARTFDRATVVFSFLARDPARDPCRSIPPGADVEETGSYALPDTLLYERAGDTALTIRGAIKRTAVHASARRVPDNAFALWDPHWFWARTPRASGGR
jgi:hypothetical protein